RALLGRARLGETHEFSVKGWRGEPVQVWVIYPPNFDPKKKWPLLHSIHGGPHAAHTDGWHFRWNTQVFAAHGYVVVGVNYHGSSGFGQAWLETITGNYGAKELAAFHWDNPARVMKQSPHNYARRFKTPTLVIHGELDYRVPATQALQYYNTLWARNVPARLVYFPDENHWILKPQNSRLWYREFFDWIKRYAAPGPSRRNA